jgi:hypothetical protein
MESLQRALNMNYSASQTTRFPFLSESLYRFLLNFLPVTLLPLLGLGMQHFYGPFLWGEFYRQFLWIMSLAFFLQLGSRQMMGLAVFNDTLEEEFRVGLQSRSILLIISCLLILFLPVSILHSLTLCGFLILRYAGDTICNLQRSAGNLHKAAIAELAFWLVLIAGIILQSEPMSSVQLLFLSGMAAAARLIAADPRVFRNILPLKNHAPDSEWISKAFQQFIPQISYFLFYTIEILLASILLSILDFAWYQITMVTTLSTGILFNALYIHSKNHRRTLPELLTVSSLALVPIVLLLQFILKEFAGVPLTPWYLLAAYFILLSGVFSAHFIHWLIEDRELKVIRNVFLGTSLLHLLLVPFLFAQFELQEYFLYTAGIQTLVAVTLLIVSYHKGYK